MEELEFFRTKERQDELLRILNEWEGTPHRHFCSVKGKGIDCTLFILEVFKELGVAQKRVREKYLKMRYQNYPPDRSLHSKEEVLLELLRSIPGVKEIGKLTMPKNGDVCCYQFGWSTSHMSIFFEGRIWHSIDKVGVYPESFMRDKFYKRLSTIFRCMEV